MNDLNEKLKKLAANVMLGLNWLGAHLGALLAIFSAVVAFLFVRERNKRQEAETKLELDEKTDAVKEARDGTQKAQEAAASSGAAYDSAIAEYRKQQGEG